MTKKAPRPHDDLIIKNVRVVRTQGNATHEADIAIADGRFARVAPAYDAAYLQRREVGIHEDAVGAAGRR